MKHILLFSFLMTGLFTTTISKVKAQPNEHSSISQKVRGRVTDAASGQPLPGVIVLLLSDNSKHALTDASGYYQFEKIPVGRQSFQFSLMGFENYTAADLMIISGKETELNVALKESLKELGEVTVVAAKNNTRAKNEFATLSARSFSVEETQRYAAAFSDPARMAMNFPGVSNAGDMENGIVVRGNSPKGILWRLEGIEIPNPNHFGSIGTSGGAISMLNANVLGQSDFYTGAFPAEFGNALSGAFDLNFRNGNSQRHEHTFQFSALGLELASEGPFKKGSKASYLVNYRYSSLAILGKFLPLGAAPPEYQDASIKLNFPTEKAGEFSFFALGGHNGAVRKIEADSSKWDDDEGNLNYAVYSTMGVTGVTHKIFLSKNSYLKSVLSTSYDRYQEKADTLNFAENYRKVPVTNSNLVNNAYRASVLYNRKLNARHTMRLGLVAQQLNYSLNYDLYDGRDETWKRLLTGNGGTQYFQAYAQWKNRLTEQITTNIGLHGSYFALNDKYSIEPRAAISYDLNRSKFSLSAGLHSKPEHLSTYLYSNNALESNIKYPNKDLDLLRAFHAVAGYETKLGKRTLFKTEVYYQYLYSIPVERDSNSAFSILNAEGAGSLLETQNRMVSEGTGRNYGIDLSIERPFARQYYILTTGSLYSSTYTTYSGEEYNTRFNRGYQINLIGGKEFNLNAGGTKLLGVNGKLLHSGGLRESPIDLTRSIEENRQIYLPGQFFTKQAPGYFRMDMGVYVKFNRQNSTHSLQLDLQNVTNRENYFFSYFDRKTSTIKQVNQIGILPNISYRIDFH